MSKNDFPSFDDFISPYSPYDISAWAAKGNEVALQKPVQLPLDENNIQDFATTICAMNLNITLAVLRDYHEWLRAQLDSKTVRLI